MCMKVFSSRKGLLSILAAISSLSSHSVLSFAHDGHEHKVAAVKPADFYKPTAMPDRIVLTLNGDPRTCAAVSWRTSTEVTDALAEIAVAESNPYFSERSKPLDAATQALKTDINEAHFHTVKFEGLKAGTKYAYRVGDGTNWSEWFHFKTATANNEPFSFIYFGDAQNNIRSMWSRLIREAYSDAPKAAFLLHAGDLINTAEADAEWGEWCGAGAWVNAMMPNVAIPGNHEMAKGENSARHVSHHWRPQFEFPLNGPKGLEESCFTIQYHNALIVGMNSNEQQSLQAEWLDKVLAENKSEWVVCTFHHPIFSTAKDRDNAELRTLWKPIFDKYKVDLVLQGHDHTYGRTGLHVPSTLSNEESTEEPAQIDSAVSAASAAGGGPAVVTVPQTIANVPTGVQQVDENTGTVYVVSVSGPKMYNIQRQPFMKRVGEDTQLYQIIHIDGNKLRFEARTAVGDLYDAFELQKKPGKVNQLIEIAPQVPEHLRPAGAKR